MKVQPAGSGLDIWQASGKDKWLTLRVAIDDYTFTVRITHRALHVADITRVIAAESVDQLAALLGAMS